MVIYNSSIYGTIEVTQNSVENTLESKANIYFDKKVYWGKTEVYVSYDDKDSSKATYVFYYNNTMVTIFCEVSFEKVMEDAFS